MHLVGERSKGSILRFNNSIKSLLGEATEYIRGLEYQIFRTI